MFPFLLPISFHIKQISIHNDLRSWQRSRYVLFATPFSYDRILLLMGTITHIFYQNYLHTHNSCLRSHLIGIYSPQNFIQPHIHTKRYVMFPALPAALPFFFFLFTSLNIFHHDIEKWKWNVIARQLFVFAVYSFAETKCRLTLSSGMNMKWIGLLSFTENHAQIWHIQLSWYVWFEIL